MLVQAVRSDSSKRLLVNGNIADEPGASKRRTEISTRLGVVPDAITVLPGTAKDFLGRPNIAEAVMDAMPAETKAEF